ncbi:MAG: methyltransferase domain-containing protein [Candidatus Dormiibacterota bacterium]
MDDLVSCQPGVTIVSSQTPPHDRWAEWLLQRRHGGDPERQQAILDELAVVRDRVIEHADLRSGDVLLDVGAGDGLIAFAAVDAVGPSGQVIFSDISEELLEASRLLAQQLGVAERCYFVNASAEDLTPIAVRSVDVVTTRSVLIYVDQKARAFAEFFRVLRQDGRIAIHEPINRVMFPEPACEFLGYQVGVVEDLADKVKAAGEDCDDQENSMLNFDEQDLLSLAEAAGFREIHLELRQQIASSRAPMAWERFLSSSGNPLAPTNGEMILAALSPAERGRFERHLRPLVEAGEMVRRLAVTDLWAQKKI